MWLQKFHLRDSRISGKSKRCNDGEREHTDSEEMNKESKIERNADLCPILWQPSNNRNDIIASARRGTK
jgi:hypothetical protein